MSKDHQPSAISQLTFPLGNNENEGEHSSESPISPPPIRRGSADIAMTPHNPTSQQLLTSESSTAGFGHVAASLQASSRPLIFPRMERPSAPPAELQREDTEVFDIRSTESERGSEVPTNESESPHSPLTDGCPTASLLPGSSA